MDSRADAREGGELMSGIIQWSCPICFQEYASEECPNAKEAWHVNCVRQHEEIDRGKMNQPVYNKKLNSAVKKEIWMQICEINPYAKTGRGNHVGGIKITTTDRKNYRGDEVRDEGGEHFTIWWCGNGRIDNFAVLRYEDILDFEIGVNEE